MEYFWKKKLMVSYVLSVFVFLIHISSFGNYSGEGAIGEINGFVSDLFSHTFNEAAVPLFFMISGALFFRNYNDEAYLKKIMSRVYSLVIPYFVWNMLGMLFAIVTSYSFISNYFVGREKFQISVTNILLAIFHHKCNGVFWFVFDLMFFCLIAPIINFIISKKWSAYVAIIILIVLAQFGVGLPDSVFGNKISIVYYMIGCMIGKHYFVFFVKKCRKKTSIISMLSVLVCIIFYYLKWNNYILVPLIVEVSICVLMCYSLWNVFDIFVNKTIGQRFMEDSFFVFALHINLSAVVAKCYSLILPKSNYFAIPNFIFTVITTLLCIAIICRILKKWFPRIYDILSGQRRY